MKYVTGNLLDMFDQGKFDIIIHGCNCFCKMKGGIAKQIAERYPQALLADEATSPGDYHKLGTFTFAKLDAKLIINGYTQFAYGSPKEKHVNYFAIHQLFTSIKSKKFDSSVRIGIPKIGAGLAGGDWNVIEGIIDEAMEDMDVTCVIYEE